MKKLPIVLGILLVAVVSFFPACEVEILSPVPLGGKCGEKDYERLFIREAEVKAREGKMAYVRPEYHDRIMRITRVIGHDRLSLSAYIDHVLTHHFNQCEEAIKSLYARNYDAVF